MTFDTHKTRRSTLVGVFQDRSAAEQAVEELRVNREGDARVREDDTRRQE